eukprot:sb/3468811/
MASEILSAEGLRCDGRRPQEMRKLKCELGISEGADGSALVEQGYTKVLVSVFGPHECANRNTRNHEKAVISCSYNLASFGSAIRKKKMISDKKSTEVGVMIQNTFEAAVMLEKFPKSQIDIYVQVLQGDGGERCVAINATTLALINAGIPMKDYVCACAATVYQDSVLLDINNLEESSRGPLFMLAVMPRTESIVQLQLDHRLHNDHLDKVVKETIQGCRDIQVLLDRQVKEWTVEAAAAYDIKPRV